MATNDLSFECANWLRKLREMWLADQHTAMSGISRFFFAFLGSLSFIVIRLFIPSIAALPFTEIFNLLYYFIGVILISVFFGCILTWHKTKAGPVRTYLSGVALPALVTYMTIFTT